MKKEQNKFNKTLLLIVATIIFLDIAILIKPPHIFYDGFSDHLFSLLCVIGASILIYLMKKGGRKDEK